MKKVILFFIAMTVNLGLFAQSKFQYTSFNTTDFKNLGVAKFVGGNARLTPSQDWVSGACWYKKKVDVGTEFSTEFKFLITKNAGSGGGADGFAFILQNDPNKKGIGRNGEGMGYAGISNCIAIEFDTYDNGEGGNNHVALQTNGRGMNSHYREQTKAINHRIPILKDKTHTVKITYKEHRLKVYMNGTEVLNYAINLYTTLKLDNGKAWVGFTSSTAGGYAQHEILQWKYESKAQPRALLPLGDGILRKNVR